MLSMRTWVLLDFGEVWVGGERAPFHPARLLWREERG
jgi:hypothetical protein